MCHTKHESTMGYETLKKKQVQKSIYKSNKHKPHQLCFTRDNTIHMEYVLVMNFNMINTIKIMTVQLIYNMY